MDRRIHVACIGGGQLGRMMALEAPQINVEMTFLDPNGAISPAAQVVGASNVTQGSLTDKANIQNLATNCDVLTVEIEHVGVEVLAELEKGWLRHRLATKIIGKVLTVGFSQPWNALTMLPCLIQSP